MMFFQKSVSQETSDLTSVNTRVSSNTLGTAVNIADKTGANTYTTTKDGYVYFCGAGASETVLNINYTGMIASANSLRNGIYVKSGTTLFFEGTTPSWAYFKPLSY